MSVTTNTAPEIARARNGARDRDRFETTSRFVAAAPRGEVEEPELIKDLEQRTKKVQGVEEVENLLHVPGAPTPTK
jgi:hypothetical protein